MTTVFSIDERTEPLHEFTILDVDGNPVQPTAITLTYYDRETGTIINSRDGQDVLDANNVTVTNGVVAWEMQVEDTIVLNNVLEAEIHVALWEWIANGRDVKHETIFRVINLRKVP